MNTSLSKYKHSKLVAAGLVLIATVATPLAIQSTYGADDKKDSSSFVEKMKQWQDKMSDTFRDTWEGWRGKKGDQGMGVASVDLREQQDNYILRLNLPNRNLSNVDIKLESSSLRVAAPAEAKVPRYEQTFVLNDVLPNGTLGIDRRQNDNLIIVTVPKTRGVSQSVPPIPFRPPSTSPLGDSDEDIFTRIENIRRDMDRMIEESLKDVGLAPAHKGFFDEPRFGSSFDLQEEGSNYVLRAYLPDRKMENVNVTLEGQSLRIEAKAEEVVKGDKGAVSSSHKAHFAQVITLPGPVKTGGMKVDKKENMLIVTLPKA